MTTDGQEVQIVDKEPGDAATAEKLVGEDGAKYVLDYASGNLQKVEDAPAKKTSSKKEKAADEE